MGNHIYLNPANNEWETADKLLSGNVVIKLNIAKEEADKVPNNVKFQRSLQALEKIQPEKIPFKLLDFNLGERWISQDYYNRFSTHLFEVNTEINYFPSLDTFKGKTSSSNAKTSQEYAVTTKSGRHIMAIHCLNTHWKIPPLFTFTKLIWVIKQFGFRIMMPYNWRTKKSNLSVINLETG